MLDCPKAHPLGVLRRQVHDEGDLVDEELEDIPAAEKEARVQLCRLTWLLLKLNTFHLTTNVPSMFHSGEMQ